MRILIRVDGSRSIGLGHTYRMLALAAVLRDRGHQVGFCSLQDSAANRLVKRRGFACETYAAGDRSSVVSRVIENTCPQMVLQDILRTDQESVRGIRSQIPFKLVHFDDTGAGLQLADAVINSIVFHWGAYDRQTVNACLYEGPEYAILQRSILSLRRRPRTFRKRRRVLIAVGGSDTQGLTVRLLSAVLACQQEMDIRVNLGPGAVPTAELNEAGNGLGKRVEIVQHSENLLSEFYRSDLVLCGGGVMLYELAALGVPAVAVATEDHEIRNLSFWEDAGTIVSAGHHSSLSTEKVMAAVANILEVPERAREMSRRGMELVDGRGLDRVVRVVEAGG